MYIPSKHINLFNFFIQISLVLFFVGCSSDRTVENKKIIQQVDSLNTAAFQHIRSRKWQEAFQLAQTSDTLSVQFQYKKGQAKSLRIQAYYWNQQNKLDSAMYVLQSAEAIEKQLLNYKGLLAVYNTKALLLKKNEMLNDALATYKKALQLTDSSISDKQQSKTHVNIANVYTKKGVYDSAIYHYQQSLFLNQDTINNRQTLLTYLNLGNVYSLSNNYALAEIYYQKALQAYIKTGNTVEIAKIYNNLGALHYEKGEDAISLEYLKKSIQLKENVSDTSELAESYLNIAELYAQKNAPLALEYLEKAETYVHPLREAANSIKIHIARANIYQHQNQFQKAKKALEKAVVLAKDSKNPTVQSYLAKKQSEFAFRDKNYQKAYTYFTEYEALKDTLFNEQKLWEIAEIQKSYQSQVKKAEINSLEKDRALAEEIALRKEDENKKLYAYLFAFAIILCLVLIIAVYFYKLKKVANQLAIQQEIVHEQRLQNLVDHQEIAIINATLAAREKEKVAISKELHNNIGSLLTSVKFHFQAFDKNVIALHEDTQKLYEKTNQILDNVTDEVRNISHRFDSNPLPDFDLKHAIANFCDKVANQQLQIHVTTHGLETVQNSAVSMFIFRILQELVNNVLKHAAASEVHINITRNADQINLMVEDNGKGFHPKKKQQGIGLKNLKKQLTQINGSCHIDSDESRGTIINIDIPIH